MNTYKERKMTETNNGLNSINTGFSLDNLLKTIKDSVKPYSDGFVEYYLQKGMSKIGIVEFYENHIVSFDLFEFVDDYLDDSSRQMWYDYYEEHGQGTLDDYTYSEIVKGVEDRLKELKQEYLNEESERIVQNDPVIEEHLEIMKEEKGDDFNLVFEVGEYIYTSVLSPSTEGCDDQVQEWCNEHKDLIIKRFEEFTEKN